MGRQRIKIITMNKLSALLLGLLTVPVMAQTDPAITSWMINTSGITGRHYVSGNSTPINDSYPANVQSVNYSANFSYINSSGIPGYIVGPYLDGNPSFASDNDWIWKIPLNPTENTGSPVTTPLGPIGVFINGVPMYDYKDGQSYSSSSMQDEMMGGDGVWNRDAIQAEMDGFDCAKGHPSPINSGPPGPGGTIEGGTYHHHQNPSAFNLDLVVVSDICDTYLADGLYTINASLHSPLIGFAFDGYPVYGAYGYADPLDAASGIVRMESSFQKRSITVRTHYADGTDVTDGPPVSASYPLGWYREDYEFIEGSGHLDIHNGRFCKTPEYPEGTYCYFATVDNNWNSAYPYLIGESYYGVVESDNFTTGPGTNGVTIDEPVTPYTASTTNELNNNELKVNVFPNPASDIIAIQVEGILMNDLKATLYDLKGRKVTETTINQGSTIWHIDATTLYRGEYILTFSNQSINQSTKILLR